MAGDDSRTLSANRRALLGVYAVLDREIDREPHLETVLRALGVRLPGDLDPFKQLSEAVSPAGEGGQVPIHRLRIAFAAIAVLRSQIARDRSLDQNRHDLEAVLEYLIDQPRRRFESPANVFDALQHAAEVYDSEYWSLVVQQAGDHLHPDLANITTASCTSELRHSGGEVVSRIETNFTVLNPDALDLVAPRALPKNWKQRNDFFCDLLRAPARDGDCPDATGGDVSAGLPFWRGVYEERVGGCPAGWYPDTFLVFTWARSDSQLILGYELSKRRQGDKTVLTIDDGYVQVDQLTDSYEVSTLKNLLFDDTFIPGGGQVLGMYACEFGWLDAALDWFSVSAPKGPGTPLRSGIDADLQAVLTRCESGLLETVADAEAQFKAANAKKRAGDYSLDDYVKDWTAVLVRAVRDGSRSLALEFEFGVRSLELVKKFTDRKVPRP